MFLIIKVKVNNSNFIWGIEMSGIVEIDLYWGLFMIWLMIFWIFRLLVVIFIYKILRWFDCFYNMLIDNN